MSEPDVLIRTERRVGRISLNRPQALHALNLDMCKAITAALLAWRDDPSIDLVLIDHTGDRGFCAGGDIRTLSESGAGDGAAAREFFFVEYRMNNLMFEYVKPIVTIMDGVTMGGGVGLATPSRHRLVTEETMYAMPETGIGLFPDVGGGWFLPRMPNHMGFWLGLTGARIRAADCKLLGIATDCVLTRDIKTFKARVIAEPWSLEILLATLKADPLDPPLLKHREEIDRIFSLPTVEAIIAALEAEKTEWANEQLKVLSAKSPQTLKVALRQLQLGAKAATFADNMKMEFRIAARVVQRPDFIEGVRAVIVDKDNAPKWNPPNLAGVTDEMLDAIFAPLPADQEWSPLP